MEKKDEEYKHKIKKIAKQKYSYVNLTEEYFSWLFDVIYRICLEKYSKFDNFNLEDIIYNLLENKIRDITIHEITKNNNLRIVNNFINKVANDHKDNYKFKTLIDYFECLDCEIDYIYLLESNKNFINIVKNYLERNYIKNNDIIRMIISAYNFIIEKKEYEFNPTINDIDINIDYNSTELLTIEEEKKLGYEILQGNKEAKKRMILSNQGLVKKIAANYYYNDLFLDYEELVSEGNIGLIKAVNKFDVRKGYKFSSYAIWWIRISITRAIANQGRTIRISVNMVDKINKLSRIRRKLTVELNRDPNEKELAEEMGISVAKVNEILELKKNIPISLDIPIDKDSDNTIENLIMDQSKQTETEAINNIFKDELLAELEKLYLSDEEKEFLYLSFGLKDDITMSESKIGQKFGITRQAINLRKQKIFNNIIQDPFFNSLSTNSTTDEYIVNKLNKIKNKRKRKSRKNICRYFQKSEDEIKKIIFKLPNNYVLFLQDLYGEDFNEEAKNDKIQQNSSMLANVFCKMNEIIENTKLEESKPRTKTKKR